MTHLIIPDELDKRLTALAEQVHVPKDEYAMQLFEQMLEDQEDYLIALAQSERIEKGSERTYSLEEVLEELDLEKKDIL